MAAPLKRAQAATSMAAIFELWTARRDKARHSLYDQSKLATRYVKV
jgi:hypothetical protein